MPTEAANAKSTLSASREAVGAYRRYMPNIQSRKPTTTKRLFAVIGSALPLSSNLPSVLSVSTQR
eukprot:957195-Prorocentrum_lima.AAC.1